MAWFGVSVAWMDRCIGGLENGGLEAYIHDVRRSI
jgi:hypothetical protein